jgi:F0F1-type ATP synthase membrane subunit b/b'
LRILGDAFLKSIISKLAVCCSLVLICCGLAFGAGGGGDGAHHAPGLDTLFWPAINFTLYACIMVYFYRRLGKPALVSRAVQVRDQLVQSAKSLAEAEGQLEKVKDRQESISGEREQIIESLNLEGQTISTTVIEQAHSSAQKIQNDIERRIKSDISKAQSEIRAAVVSRATVLARQALEAELSAEDDLNLRKAAISSVLS